MPATRTGKYYRKYCGKYHGKYCGKYYGKYDEKYYVQMLDTCHEVREVL